MWTATLSARPRVSSSRSRGRPSAGHSRKNGWRNCSPWRERDSSGLRHCRKRPSTLTCVASKPEPAPERRITMRQEDPSMKKSLLIAFSVVLAGAFLALAAPDDKKASTPKKAGAMKSHKVVMQNDIQWGDAPPSLPPGAKMAVLSGDPGKAGAYTLRLKAPDGYKVASHWHPTDENLTIISG